MAMVYILLAPSIKGKLDLIPRIVIILTIRH